MASSAGNSRRRPSRATPSVSGAGRWPMLGLALASASCVPVSASPQAPLSFDPFRRRGARSTGGAAPVEFGQAASRQPVRARPAFRLARPHRARPDALARLPHPGDLLRGRQPKRGRQARRGPGRPLRVRHPSWPNSVCGVVYQGPMRPGGGCQFTFTCDGSLTGGPPVAWRAPAGLAVDALAGRAFAAVGLSTYLPRQCRLPVLGAPSCAGRRDRRPQVLPPARNDGEPGAFTAAAIRRPAAAAPVNDPAPALPTSLPSFALRG